MPQLELYENKEILDPELPVQISRNVRSGQCWIFKGHWHEHLELHYIVEGEATFYLNQQQYQAVPGDLIIVNSNELHAGFCTKAPYLACVTIFDIGDISPELAKKNCIFSRHNRDACQAGELMQRICGERFEGEIAYKQACKGLVLELLAHLCRNYVTQTIPERDSRRRKKDLDRLNTVLNYIEKHISEPITNAQLAKLACLSEDRFCHVFSSGVGKPPLQYINDLRLKKALGLLESGEHTVTEVAESIGFRDYNHFGRLFRKRYGCTPYDIKSGRVSAEEAGKNSGNV